MKSDNVLAFIRAAYSGDRDLMDRQLDVLIANERNGKHEAVADRLERARRAGHGAAPKAMVPLPKAAKEQLTQSHRRESLDELVLSKATRRLADQVIREHQNEDALREAGLSPSQRVLLVGPPGNGKTSLASAFATALERPLFVLNYGRLIGSHLGETGARLVKILEDLQNVSCVLLMDEFDTIGRTRRTESAAASTEMARVTNVLLTELEALPPCVLWVGATNYAQALDEALWRRFDHILWVEPPSPKALQIWAERYLKPPVGAEAFVEVWSEHVPENEWSFGLARAAADHALRSAAVGDDWGTAIQLWFGHRQKAMADLGEETRRT